MINRKIIFFLTLVFGIGSFLDSPYNTLEAKKEKKKKKTRKGKRKLGRKLGKDMKRRLKKKNLKNKRKRIKKFIPSPQKVNNPPAPNQTESTQTESTQTENTILPVIPQIAIQTQPNANIQNNVQDTENKDQLKIKAKEELKAIVQKLYNRNNKEIDLSYDDTGPQGTVHFQVGYADSLIPSNEQVEKQTKEFASKYSKFSITPEEKTEFFKEISKEIFTHPENFPNLTGLKAKKQEKYNPNQMYQPFNPPQELIEERLLTILEWLSGEEVGKINEKLTKIYNKYYDMWKQGK